MYIFHFGWLGKKYNDLIRKKRKGRGRKKGGTRKFSLYLRKKGRGAKITIILIIYIPVKEFLISIM